MGELQPRSDLADYLWHELRISYNEMASEREGIDRGELEHVINEWKKIRKRKSDHEEDTYEMLVRHDVMAYLLIDDLRNREPLGQGYGPSYWWLTIDRAGYRYDQRKRLEEEGRGISVCMSPDFFIRFLSLAPKGEAVEKMMAESMTTCLELAGLGLVPMELREQTQMAYVSTETLPSYVRRRKLRDLLSKASEEKGGVFDADDPVDYVVRMDGEVSGGPGEIEEHLP